MSFTWEDFERWYIKDHFRHLRPEEQREAIETLSPEQRRELLRSVGAEERREILRSMPAEERREILRSVPAEERREILQSLPTEERLAGVPVEQIRQYLDQLTAGEPSKRRRKRP